MSRLTARVTDASGEEATASVDVTVDGSAPQPIFSDDFESGRSSPLWGNSSNNVTVEDAPDRAGKALRFLYHGKPSGQDSTAVQRFDLGGAYRDIAIEYDLYVPPNFFHREEPTGPDNNKLLRLWSGERTTGDAISTGVFAGASFIPWRDGSGNCDAFLQWADHDNRPLAGQDGAMNLVPGGISRGSWGRLGWRFKLASAEDAFDGFAELWLDGDLRLSQRNLDWYGDPNNAFTVGYLMGWANSGYAEDTSFYIDDFKVWDRDPGW